MSRRADSGNQQTKESKRETRQSRNDLFDWNCVRRTIQTEMDERAVQGHTRVSYESTRASDVHAFARAAIAYLTSAKKDYFSLALHT